MKPISVPERKARAAALVPFVVSGVTVVDDSAQTETSAFKVLTITPQFWAALSGVEVWLDLAKATTGFAAVESTATVQFAVARKVDGTNWRREAYVEAALSGTNAAGRMAKINVGKVTVNEQVAIYAVFSADVASDIEIPFSVSGHAIAPPTVTPTTAG